jgi:hypothetical protein
MKRVFLSALMLAALMSVSGCDNELENQTPTEPAPTTTDVFPGSISINGAANHTFPVVAAGRVTATLTEITPDPAIAVGFALGRWNASSSFCEQIIPNDNALQGQILLGDASGIGTLCVRIYDTGKLTGPINYSISVVHP